MRDSLLVVVAVLAFLAVDVNGYSHKKHGIKGYEVKSSNCDFLRFF